MTHEPRIRALLADAAFQRPPAFDGESRPTTPADPLPEALRRSTRSKLNKTTRGELNRLLSGRNTDDVHTRVQLPNELIALGEARDSFPIDLDTPTTAIPAGEFDISRDDQPRRTVHARHVPASRSTRRMTRPYLPIGVVDAGAEIGQPAPNVDPYRSCEWAR